MTLRFRARHAALRPASLAAPLLFVGALLLSGCAAAVPMQPAADATHPSCADVVVHLPSSVADKTELETNAQGTGAWGEPGNSSVLLHCGVAVPGPTTLPCVSINGVDWIEDDADAPLYRFTTYGRTPAVEVIVDSKAVAGSTVLADLSNSVSVIRATGACVGADDVTLPSGTPAP
jgi:hypothetical protein